MSRIGRYKVIAPIGPINLPCILWPISTKLEIWMFHASNLRKPLQGEYKTRMRMSMMESDAKFYYKK